MEPRQEHEDRWHLPFAEHPQLEVAAEMVSITLLPVQPGEEPWIEFIAGSHGRERGLFGLPGKGRRSHIAVEVRRSGDTVEVTASGPIPGGLVFHVPPRIEASVRTEVGSAEARDLGPCGLTLESEAGQIRVHNVSGRLHLSSEAGRIEGKHLSGRFHVETEAGSVRLEILALDPGRHHISAEVGSVHLDLAPGLPVQFEATSEGGKLSIDYPEHPDPTAVVRVETEVGSVRVRQMEMGPMPHIPPTPPTPPIPPALPIPPVTPEPTEDGELERILKMVEEGRLSAGEAQELIRAIGEG